MTWQDRVAEASYSSPSGKIVSFDFEDLTSYFEKKTAGFEFLDADGTYVQDNGVSSRRFPMRCIFWGEDCDIQADGFELILSERGEGELNHPLKGKKVVVPFGSITRIDSLKTQANQAIVELEFWETIGLVYPSGNIDPVFEIASIIASFKDSFSDIFAFNVSRIISNVVRAKTAVSKVLVDINSTLNPVASVTPKVEEQFRDLSDTAQQNIELLAVDAKGSSDRLINLVEISSETDALVFDKISSYNNLYAAVIDRPSQSIYTDDLIATSTFIGLAKSMINSKFTNRVEAVAAAELVISQFDRLVSWREQNLFVNRQSITSIDIEGKDSNPNIDTGETYQQLQILVSLVAGYLVDISFDLRSERIVTITRDRTIVDLCGEYYCQIDRVLDFFIDTNNLSGDEMIELKAGRQIVYYA